MKIKTPSFNQLCLAVAIFASIYFLDAIMAKPKSCEVYRYIVGDSFANADGVRQIPNISAPLLPNDYVVICPVRGFLPITRKHVVLGKWYPSSTYIYPYDFKTLK